jgi:hypothetical protein
LPLAELRAAKGSTCDPKTARTVAARVSAQFACVSLEPRARVLLRRRHGAQKQHGRERAPVLPFLGELFATAGAPRTPVPGSAAPAPTPKGPDDSLGTTPAARLAAQPGASREARGSRCRARRRRASARRAGQRGLRLGAAHGADEGLEAGRGRGHQPAGVASSTRRVCGTPRGARMPRRRAGRAVVAHPQRELALEDVEALVVGVVDVQRRCGRRPGRSTRAARSAAGLRAEMWKRTRLRRNQMSVMKERTPGRW